MEQIVSNGIIDSYFNKLKQYLSVDVAIVGGGPSGLVASYYLAKNNYKVAIYERKLAPGGGMWGGAMMFNEIVVQKPALHILDELSIEYREFEHDFYVIDSVHAASALIYNASKAGVKIFNCTSVEDVVFLDNKVCGIVLNWAPVAREHLEIDPLVIMAKVVVDSTGHDCDVAHTLERKNNIKLNTETGKVIGERSLSINEGENSTIDNTKEIYPGLFVTGMAANGVSGSFRMGPIFGGMILSGKKVADLIINKIKNT
jgi:thiamine thiazole synthase